MSRSHKYADLETVVMIQTPSSNYVVYFIQLCRRAMSSVNPQVRAVNKRSTLGQQKHSGRLEVLWRAQTSQQGTSHPRLLDFGVLLEQLVGHGGSDVAGRQSVDSDAVLTPFLSDRSTHLLNCGFARVVCGARETLESVSLFGGTGWSMDLLCWQCCRTCCR